MNSQQICVVLLLFLHLQMYKIITALVFGFLFFVMSYAVEHGAIPRVVWQTYKTRQLPNMAALFANTWRTTNPEWSVRLFDDADARRFISMHFGALHVEVFDSYPIGVMRADFWRYCVLFKEGGVYADVDTLSEQPIESWLMGGSRGLVVGVENELHLVQWVLAAKPNHPALAAVIVEVMRRATEPRCRAGGFVAHSVHHCTGPAVFTDAVLRFARVESVPQLTLAAATVDIFVHAHHVLNGQAVQHAFGSVSWGAPYISWRRQVDALSRSFQSPSEYPCE